MVSSRASGQGRETDEGVLTAWFELERKGKYAGELLLEMTFYSNVRCLSSRVFFSVTDADVIDRHLHRSGRSLDQHRRRRHRMADREVESKMATMTRRAPQRTAGASDWGRESPRPVLYRVQCVQLRLFADTRLTLSSSGWRFYLRLPRRRRRTTRQD
jgi:hypothetical protein